MTPPFQLQDDDPLRALARRYRVDLDDEDDPLARLARRHRVDLEEEDVASETPALPRRDGATPPTLPAVTVTPSPSLMRRAEAALSPVAASDATRAVPHRPAEPDLNLAERVGAGVIGFGRSLIQHPGETVKEIVAAPVRSAGQIIAPSEDYAQELSTPGSEAREREQFIRVARGFPVLPDTVEGVSGKERALAVAQTAANVAAGPIASRVAKATGPALGALGSKVAAGSAAGLPIGAAYTPDDPLAGALTVGVVGGAIPAAGKAVKPAIRPAARVVGKAAQEAERLLQLLRQRQAAKEPTAPKAPEVAPVPPVAPTPEAPAVPVQTLPVSEIRVDPQRFQFKRGVDESGVTRELKSVEKFNPTLAGLISVWRDPADGGVYVVNGHHRVELARRTGTPSVNVQFIEAPDAPTARATGAILNIAEGRGTAVDAAKFFRDTGLGPDALKAEGVSVAGKVAKDGLALSRLAPDVFDQVASGKIEDAHGVAIGSLLESPAQQRTAVQMISGSPRALTTSHVTELARQIRAAGETIVTQETLFGSEDVATSLMLQRAEVAAEIRRRLSNDKRLFGFVTKGERAQELARGGNVIDLEASRNLASQAAMLEEGFTREAHAQGPIGQAITEAARRLASGEKLRTVVDDIYQPIGEQLREAIDRATAGRGPGVEAVERGGTGEGAGPGGTTAAVAPDPNQAGLFSAEPLQAVARKYGVAIEGDTPLAAPARKSQPDLFGSEPPPASQGSLFGEQAGTEGSRRLSQTEAAATAELARLRQRLSLETDPTAKAKTLLRVVELEKLVNRNKAIGPDELARRRSVEPEAEPPTELPGQQALFTPAARGTPLGARVKQALGLTPAQGALKHLEVQTLATIAQNMAKALDLPLSQGRFWAKQRQALGVFYPRAETARVIRWDHMTTVSHEVGHFVSKKYLRNPTMRGAAGRGAPKLTTQAARELVQMGRDLYGNRKPAGGYGEEGIAQWARFYVTEPGRLATDAPSFSAFMEQVFKQEPELGKILGEAQSRFKDYQAAGANARADALISVGERTRNLPTAEGLVRAVLDDLDPIRKGMEVLGKSKDANTDAYVLARLTRGAAGMAEEMVRAGVTNFKTGQRVTGPLVETLKAIPPNRMQAFRRYLVAERTLEVAPRGIDTGMGIGDAQWIAATTRAEFQKPAQVVWDYSRALLEYRRDAGLLTPDEFNAILKNNKKRVGFYRVFDETESMAGGGATKGGAAMAKSSAGLPALKGSARRILDPLENLITDTYQTISASNAHHAASVLLEQALKTQGGGRVAELVEPPKRPVSVSFEQAKSQIAEKMAALGIDIPDSALLEKWEGLLTVFEEKARATGAETKDLVLPWVHNGERVWIQVHDRPLYEALTGIEAPKMDVWRRILSVPTRTLRAGATLTAEFIARNPVRDAWSAAIYSKGGFKPPGWNLTEGLFHSLRRDDLYQRWKLEGGDNASMLGLDRPQLQRELRSFLRTPAGKAVDVVIHPIQTLRMVSNLMENATRVGEFAAVERKLYRDRNLTPDNANTYQQRAIGREAAFASRDVTVDFAKAGWLAREANHLVAFLNANVQGTAKLARELRERPNVVMPRVVASVTIPSIMLYLLQRNDPAYQNLPQWRRDTMWNIVQRDESGEVAHIWSIPRPFELGILFGTVPERILQWIDSRDPAALDGLLDRLGQSFVPPYIPTAIVPIVENFANRSTFRDRPIVPPSTERLTPGEQAAAGTGEAARLLGGTLNYPPAKIENLIRGYTGGLGGYGMAAADAVVRQGRETMRLPALPAPSRRTESDPLKRVPGLRAFLAPEPAADAESVQRLYDEYERNEAIRQTFMRKPQEERAAYFAKHRDAILSVATAEENGGQAGWLREAYNEVSKINRARSALRRSGLSATERAAQERDLNRQTADLTSDLFAAFAKRRKEQREARR